MNTRFTRVQAAGAVGFSTDMTRIFLIVSVFNTDRDANGRPILVGPWLFSQLVDDILDRFSALALGEQVALLQARSTFCGAHFKAFQDKGFDLVMEPATGDLLALNALNDYIRESYFQVAKFPLGLSTAHPSVALYNGRYKGVKYLLLRREMWTGRQDVYGRSTLPSRPFFEFEVTGYVKIGPPLFKVPIRSNSVPLEEYDSDVDINDIVLYEEEED